MKRRKWRRSSMDMSPSTFRMVRVRLDLSQEEMAERLGVSERTIIRIEAGQAQIRPSVRRDVTAMLFED